MMPTGQVYERQSPGEARRVQLVTFRLDQHAFAVPVEQVWRVEALADYSLASVPGAAAYLEGLINLRGRIIPVIDLKTRLGLAQPLEPGASRSHPPKARLLIVEMEIAGQKDEKVAMIVDTVNDIRWFAGASLHPPPPVVADIDHQYLLGVLEEEGRLWIVLELRKVLSVEERRTLSSEAEKGQDSALPAAGDGL